MRRMDLPALDPDQVALVATVDSDGPAVIPVSAIHRLGPGTLLFALARKRASLARLRADPRTSVLLCGHGFSISARGRTTVAADPLPGAEFMVALRFDAADVWDTRGAATQVDAGVAWHWTDPGAGERHEDVLMALRRLGEASAIS